MNKIKEIRFIDLFSGIGGFRQGLELSGGYRCVWSCDWDKYANQVYTAQFGEENHYSGDVTGVSPEEIPSHDLLCAGFPCQSFSTAGQRQGFQDTRGSTFFEICRIAEHHKPTLLLLENVRGLLSAKAIDEQGNAIEGTEGHCFYIITQALEELGYWWEYQVLNSKYFGVPQNRRRVFIIGHLGGGSTRPIFPITKNGEYPGKGIRETPDEQIASSVIAGYGKQNMRGSYIVVQPFPLAFLNRNQKNFENIAMTVDVRQSTGIMISNTLDCDGYLRRGERDRDENGRPILTSMNKRRIRRYTPLEAERLQGFPDTWTKGISDTQRIKCLGNAVTVNVIKFLGDKIRESINSKSKRTEPQ